MAKIAVIKIKKNIPVEEITVKETIKLLHISSDKLIPKLKEISNAKISGLNKTILVNGTSEEIKELKKIISTLDFPQELIEIRATIIDTSDNLFERMGINFSGEKDPIFNNTSESLWKFNEGDFSLAGILKKGGVLFGIDIDLLKENGDIRIEAMPVILILDGETGELRVTEEVIVGEKKYEKNDEEYTEPVFSEAGVVFKIKPEVKGAFNEKSILLQIDSEISNFKLSSNFNAEQGAKQKNEIKTTILIEDGGSIFIGGLKQNVSKESEKRVPVLSKIPVIGALFKYKRTDKEIRDIYIEIEGKIK